MWLRLHTLAERKLSGKLWKTDTGPTGVQKGWGQEMSKAQASI